MKFLKSKDPSDGSEEALVEELKTLNEYLKTNVSIWKCSDHLSLFKLVACTGQCNLLNVKGCRGGDGVTIIASCPCTGT